jgi:hypothetical protein
VHEYGSAELLVGGLLSGVAAAAVSTPRLERLGGIMSTTTLALILQQELDRLAPRYASLCTQHPPLSAFPTLPALVSRLADPEKNRSEASKRERSVLLAAVIAAFQPANDRLWGAILVAAFRPMLAATHLYGADPEEREGIFFGALVEVIDKLDVRERPDEVHAAVWRAAKRVLVRKLRRQVAWSDVGFGDEADETPDRTSWLPQPLLAAWLLTRGKKDRPDIDLLIRVSEWGSLRTYVDGQHAASPPEERSRIYGRLRKRHRRVVREVHKMFRDASEPVRPSGSVPLPRARRGCVPTLPPWPWFAPVSPRARRWRRRKVSQRKIVFPKVGGSVAIKGVGSDELREKSERAMKS